jgi:hypothetical protein
MRKASFLVLAGCLATVVAYQLLTSDSMADVKGSSAEQALEIAARNATYSAFAEARRLVDQAGPSASFAPPGTRLEAKYGSASYRTRIISQREAIFIHSTSSVVQGRDTVSFAISAEVTWTLDSSQAAGDTATSYLVLKAYREGI